MKGFNYMDSEYYRIKKEEDRKLDMLRRAAKHRIIPDNYNPDNGIIIKNSELQLVDKNESKRKTT